MSKDKSPFQDDIFLRGARLRARQSADARELRHEAGLAESEEFFQALVAAVAGEVGAGSFWEHISSYVAGSEDLDTAMQAIDASWPR